MDVSILAPLLNENVEQIIPNGTIVRGKANVISGMSAYMGYLQSQPKPDRVESKKTGILYCVFFFLVPTP